MDGGMGMQRERRLQFVDAEITRLRNSLTKSDRIYLMFKKERGTKSKKRSQVPSRFDRESPKQNYFE